MKTIYKLTSQNLQTHNGFQWTPGEWTPEADGAGELCSNSFYHFYTHPLLAVLLNPIHANLSNPVLWKGEARGTFKDDRGLKGGATQMRIVERLEVPKISTIQKVAFALLCAKEIYTEASFVRFADSWLKGEDRSDAAANAANAAANAAYAAAYAANAAAYAANAAAYAANAANAAYAANAAAYAANAAAYAAANAATPVDFIELAKQAMKVS